MEKNNRMATTGNAVAKVLEGKTKYADDYTLIETTGKDGKKRTRARYIGEWTVVTEEPRRARAKIYAAASLAVLQGVALLFLQLTVHASGGKLYVGLPKVLALFPLLYLGMGLFRLPFGLKPLRRDRYMTGMIRFSRSGTGIAVLMLLTLAGDLIYRFTSGDWLYMGGDWSFLLLAILVLLGAVFSVWILNRVELAQRSNTFYREDAEN